MNKFVGDSLDQKSEHLIIQLELAIKRDTSGVSFCLIYSYKFLVKGIQMNPFSKRGFAIESTTSLGFSDVQELPPVLFTLMKSTEPFLDEYYLTDLERVMKETGFANVQTVLTDPRHRTVTATVPY